MEINDIAKETVVVMNYFEPDIISKVPNNVLKKLQQLSQKSNKKVKIDITKKLSELDILDETKDLISLIYYTYIATDKDKLRLKKLWNQNEMKYQEELKNKYNVDKMFTKKNFKKEESLEVVVDKKNIFQRIFEKIKTFLSKLNKKIFK